MSQHLDEGEILKILGTKSMTLSEIASFHAAITKREKPFTQRAMEQKLNQLCKQVNKYLPKEKYLSASYFDINKDKPVPVDLKGRSHKKKVIYCIPPHLQKIFLAILISDSLNAKKHSDVTVEKRIDSYQQFREHLNTYCDPKDAKNIKSYPAYYRINNETGLLISLHTVLEQVLTMSAESETSIRLLVLQRVLNLETQILQEINVYDKQQRFSDLITGMKVDNDDSESTTPTLEYSLQEELIEASSIDQFWITLFILKLQKYPVPNFADFNPAKFSRYAPYLFKNRYALSDPKDTKQKEAIDEVTLEITNNKHVKEINKKMDLILDKNNPDDKLLRKMIMSFMSTVLLSSKISKAEYERVKKYATIWTAQNGTNILFDLNVLNELFHLETSKKLKKELDKTK